LRKQHIKIETKEQARAIPQIGSRLADKIEEIVSTNKLQRLEHAKSDPNEKVMQLFMGIYGVGLAVSSKWIAQGHRTLEDIRTKVDLTPNQRIGLEHYKDFGTRIPRAEVAEHARIVQDTLRKFDPGFECIVGGSYRRGKADSGDIDCLITKKGANIEHVRTILVESVIPFLFRIGFLKAALATSQNRDDGSKWHGTSALPNSKVWRRIDLLFVPWDEFGAALIYFTGNDIFNRSIRLLASKKGMRLNQHGLYKDVMRGRRRERITEGTLVEGRSEEKILEVLGVKWRPPEDRNC
jgi:DNA polymerase IV